MNANKYTPAHAPSRDEWLRILFAAQEDARGFGDKDDEMIDPLLDIIRELQTQRTELLEALKSIMAMYDYPPDGKWFPQFDGIAFSRKSEGWNKAASAIARADGTP